MADRVKKGWLRTKWRELTYNPEQEMVDAWSARFDKALLEGRRFDEPPPLIDYENSSSPLDRIVLKACIWGLVLCFLVLWACGVWLRSGK